MTAPKRRWFQFSLVSMLWLTALVGVSIFAVREHLERSRLELELAPLKQNLELEWAAYKMKMASELARRGKSKQEIDAYLESADERRGKETGTVITAPRKNP